MFAVRRRLPVVITSLSLLTLAVSVAVTQGPPPRGGGPGGRRNAGTAEEFTTRLMSLDANQDGRLVREEVTDSRLQSMFVRADRDKDGEVTSQELAALYERESTAGGSSDGRGPDGRGFGPGGPPDGDFGRDGPMPREGFGGQGRGPQGGPPRPGEVLPPFVREQLNLSRKQTQELDELQRMVDQRLSRILTEEQMSQLQQPRRGGGPGGPGQPREGGFGPEGRGPEGRGRPPEEGSDRPQRPRGE
ncbi:MAG: EF-hand domain-containing protein [Planctomycetaceae bacterium]|nr:EF-hand domain-containing protein [Planctomycetaceae bacterium]